MKYLSSLAIAGAAMTVFAAASPAFADGWDRSRTVVGPEGGVWTFNGRGSCDHGECSSEQRWTGPGGGTVTRRGGTRCYDGVCEGTAKWTGPRGNSGVVKRRFERY